MAVSTRISGFAVGTAAFFAVGIVVSLTMILSDLPSAVGADATPITVDCVFAVSTLVSGLGASEIIVLFAACVVSVIDIF